MKKIYKVLCSLSEVHFQMKMELTYKLNMSISIHWIIQLIYYANVCLTTDILKPLTFIVTMDMLRLKSAILFLFLFSFSAFLSVTWTFLKLHFGLPTVGF